METENDWDKDQVSGFEIGQPEDRRVKNPRLRH